MVKLIFNISHLLIASINCLFLHLGMKKYQAALIKGEKNKVLFFFFNLQLADTSFKKEEIIFANSYKLFNKHIVFLVMIPHYEQNYKVKLLMYEYQYRKTPM